MQEKVPLAFVSPEPRYDMVDKLIEITQKAGLWLSNKPNRLRLRGARIELIAMILSREPAPSILLGQSPYHNIWMPPQEGVGIAEGFEQALIRCLEVECGLDLPKGRTELSRLLYIRSIRFAGTVELPSERQGERPVADDALGTPLEHVILKRKAYWHSTILVSNVQAITPKADGKELLDLRWFKLDEARQAILETNHPDKADLLIRCFDACVFHLQGTTERLHPERPNRR